MKQGLLIAAASVAMLATPAIASADDTEGWYLRANLGYGTHQDIDLEGDVTSDFGNGIQSEGNAAMSFGVGYDFSNNWRVEVDGDSLWTDNGSISGLTDSTAKLRTTSTMLNAIYDFDDFNGWAPYLGAGAGLVRSKLDATARSVQRAPISPALNNACPTIISGPNSFCRVSDSDVSFGWQALAGLGYRISDHIIWDTHYSYQDVSSPDFQGFQTNGTATLSPISTTASGVGSHSLVTGFRYLWGGSKAIAAAPVAALAPVRTGWTCWDGSVVSAAGECPSAPQSWSCWDGSVVSDTANCPATQQVEVITYQCWDGSSVSDTSQCPAQISARGNDVASLCGEQYRQEIIYHEFDKGASAETRDTVGRILDIGQYCNVDNIRVIGHTDSSGSAAYNLNLSKKRAADARAELVRQGIAAERITSEGKGETELFVQTGDGVKEQLNRRTEVLISLSEVGVIN